jgi:hypothetical protein
LRWLLLFVLIKKKFFDGWFYHCCNVNKISKLVSFSFFISFNTKNKTVNRISPNIKLHLIFFLQLKCWCLKFLQILMYHYDDL